MKDDIIETPLKRNEIKIIISLIDFEKDMCKQFSYEPSKEICELQDYLVHILDMNSEF